MASSSLYVNCTIGLKNGRAKPELDFPGTRHFLGNSTPGISSLESRVLFFVGFTKLIGKKQLFHSKKKYREKDLADRESGNSSKKQLGEYKNNYDL